MPCWPYTNAVSLYSLWCERLFVLSVMWTPFNISLNPQHLSLIQYWILCVLCVTYTSSTLLFHGTLNEYSTLVKYWHYLFRKVYIFHFRHAFRSHQVKKNKYALYMYIISLTNESPPRFRLKNSIYVYMYINTYPRWSQNNIVSFVPESSCIIDMHIFI